MDVLVVGAGVSGLTTAIVMAEAGISVVIHSDRPPSATTSAMAGASWGPFLARDPRIERWSLRSFERFSSIAGTPGSGVRMVAGVEAYDDHFGEIPQWAKVVSGFAVCDDDEVPTGYVGAWRYTIPLIDMPRYLDYLVDRLVAARGAIIVGETLRSIGESTADLVVNCAGLGATELVADTQLEPVRGQLICVPNVGIDEFFQDNVVNGDSTSIIPHQDHVVLGGTSKAGHVSLEWDALEEAGIRRRCEALQPCLIGLPVIGRRVGLRPSRPSVRLERDPSDTRVIHNYGHGGSGVTLSWGCAADVLDLVHSG